MWTLLVVVLFILLGFSILQAEEPSVTRGRAFSGTQIGTTYFDAQHLTSMGRQIAHISRPGDYNDTVCIAVVERYSTSDQAYLSFYYLDDYDGYWDLFAHNSFWEPEALAPDLDLFGNRALVGYARQREDIDPWYGKILHELAYTGIYTETSIPVATCGSEYTGTNEWLYSFPKVALDVNQYGDTSVHVITTEAFDYDFTEMRSLVYFKGDSYPLDFGTCGTFIDSVMTRGAVIAASKYSDKVAIAYLAPREKDASLADQRDNDLMIIKSTDDGLTWWPAQNVTNYQDNDPERAYPDITITEYNDDFHIVWTAIEYDYSTDTYSDQKCRLKHWSDYDDQITTFLWADNEQSCAPGHRVLNIAKPTLTECDNGLLYVVYTRFPGDTDAGTEDCSAGGYANGEIYAQVAVDGGLWWGEPINLTNTTTNNCGAGNCSSENWPSTPHNCYDSLRIVYIGDTDAGAYEACKSAGCREGSQTQCDIMFLEKECFDFVPYADWHVSNDDFSVPPMTCEPNGVIDTSFIMVNRGSMELSLNHGVGSGSAAPYLVFNGDNYLIGHARDTATFGITFFAPSTPGTYSGELFVEIYQTSETITIPIAVEVTGQQEYECGDVNLDGVVDADDEADLYQYLFNGDDLDSLELGNVDQCGGVNCGDLSYWLEWEYWGGPAPCEGSVAYCDETREGCFIELGCPEYVYKGERVTVQLPVYLTNDVPLIGVTLGFKHNSQDATGFAIGDAGEILGSWPPPQPSCEYCGFPENLKALYYFRGDGTTVLAPQSGGLAAYVSLALPSSAIDQVINVDTATVPYLLEPMFVPLGGGMIRPHYYDCGAGEIFVGNCESGIGDDCYYMTETGTGTDVDVDLGDVDLNFGEITSAGLTWMTITTTGETPPSGYVMQPASEPLYYNVTTDAGYTGTIEICIDYSSRNIHPFDEPGLALFHYESGNWVDITTSLDTDNDIICGHSTTLSPFILASPALPSTVVTLDAVKDNTIYEESENSNGSGSYFFAGFNENEFARRALIAFDIAGSIPAGARIDSVCLDLHMSRTQANDFDVSLYHVLEDWGEGASNAPANEGGGTTAAPGDATWIHTFYDTDLWQNAGGYYYSQPAATIEIDQDGFYTWGPTPEMQFDVQNWLDISEDNFGWILIGYEVEPSAKRFDSRENEVPANRPKLRVYYYIQQAPYICGDADGNTIVNISDAVSLIAYIFGGGPAPDPLLSGDGDCNQIVNISDAVYLIAYIFGGGPAPCAACS